MNLQNILLALSIVGGLAACAPSGKVLTQIDGTVLDLSKTSPFNIINGKEIEPTDTFAASIVGIYNLEKKTLCTGSLISETHVLTAAHCLAFNPKNLRVFFGPELSRLSVYLKVNNATKPSFWGKRLKEPTDWGDIAVLKIEGTLPPGYRPIPVLQEDLLQKGQPTLIAGYGLYDGVKREGSGLLRKTIVPIDNPQLGASEASLDQTVGSGACHGDSGGPAYFSSEAGISLWGVTSRGLDDAADDCTHFAVYTKAIFYNEWIYKAKLALDQAAAQEAAGKDAPPTQQPQPNQDTVATN